MLSREHIQILVQSVAVVLALHFAKGYLTGEYRNLMAVGLVVVVLMAADRLLSEYEGADTKKDDSKKDDDNKTGEYIGLGIGGLIATVILFIGIRSYFKNKSSSGYQSIP